ncbi:MAG TPA: ABC transporter substrate-binding protein [Pseudonocardiaceae bacterium]|jgi:hypothetical protein|nr:ABC transporter substrate-binding protein [Pseudonocardiaceae bacterium]
MSTKDSVVDTPRFMWPRRHPWLAGALVVVLLFGVVVGGRWLVGRLFAPALTCGAGMSANAASTACVGVDLTGGPLSPADPPRLGALENTLRDNNNAVTGSYVSIVLLENMTPDEKVDTETYDDLIPDIEGAVAAVWRANHTDAWGTIPQVKLFLGNLGSQNASWSAATDEIGANAAANHITSVIGLGQSTLRTRQAAARLTERYHLPVIGSTVTGDDMNTDPSTGARMPGFFRVAPTNDDTVAAAARYITGIEPDPSKVAIVFDDVAGDDYTQTLGLAARRLMPTAHQFPFTSQTDLPAGVERGKDLAQKFTYVDPNICTVAPKVIYFAGRGVDLGAFVQTWIQSGTPCATTGKLTVVTGDDGDEAIDSEPVRQAIAGGHVAVLFTPLASPDEWGRCMASGSTAAEQANYDQFQAAFTGQPDVCTGQSVIETDHAGALTYRQADLRTGQAMLNQDAAAVAITAARRDSVTVVQNPLGQISIMQEMRCTTGRIAGASGWIVYSADPANYGNPIGKPIPMVTMSSDGTIHTVAMGGDSPAASAC